MNNKHFKSTLVAVALAGLGSAGVGCGKSAPPASQAPTGTPTASSLTVVTEPAKRESLSSVTQLSGQVQPTEDRTVVLTAPLDGVVVRPLVKVGSLVTQGQPLVEMNSVYGMTGLQVLEKLETQQDAVVDARTKLTTAVSSLSEARASMGRAESQVSSVRSDMRQAEAEVAFARGDLKRKRLLFDAGINPRSDVDEANTKLVKAQATLTAAREELLIAQQQVPLMRANIGSYEQAVALARQGVALTESNYERNRQVLSQSSLVGTQISPSQSALSIGSSAGSSVNAADASGFQLRAPITGVVTRLTATTGQRLSSGTDIGQVVELSKVYVDANAFEGDVSRLHEGDAIEVTSTSTGGAKLKGRIRYVGKQVNPTTRTIQVRSLIDNPKGVLRPDMFVDVSVVEAARAGAVTVPQEAILTLGSQEYVMVQTAPGKYDKREVEIGSKAGQRVEVLKGLKEGEQVVTEGSLLLESRE